MTRLGQLVKERQEVLWLGAALVFILPFSIYTLCMFLHGSDLLGVRRLSMVSMLDGTGRRPHVYRQLVPWMVHVLAAITPDMISEPVVRMLHDGLRTRGLLMIILQMRRRRWGGAPEMNDEHLYPFALAVLVDYAFLLGYVYFVWKVARAVYPRLFSAQVIAPCLAILVVPSLNGYFAWFYDFPVLFFSAWLTYALVRGQWVIFTLGVGLATLNKETAFFYIMLFGMYGYFRLPRAEWRKHLVVQCALFAAIKGAVTWYYAGNVGDFLWFTLYGHVMENLGGYRVQTAVGLIAAAGVIGYGWRRKPYILRCWMAIVPISVLSWLAFGLRGEYRVMYEVAPALVLMASGSVAMWVQGSFINGRKPAMGQG